MAKNRQAFPMQRNRVVVWLTLPITIAIATFAPISVGEKSCPWGTPLLAFRISAGGTW